ncbi:4Fe-4S dicluster domain-containing protein [Magnetospirillum sp. UT-4]|uniref:4Fe-4S dicluster domain-containing protein n=1 Tax=Magnetospirillum sp. UT-4 TaxID=2681467 RepID=UPI0013842E5E|nr:4Fe-4S dicluster domain-containing protein [Magnetospirillum sp. UT-4]CAA7625537.1 Ferredoxin-type protein NapF [Magnetospirillum sp. UT-4]
MSRSISRRAFLGRTPDTQPPPSDGARVATLSGGCLAAAGTTCMACADPCEPRALRLRPLPGGRALPLIDAVLCTGCGDCLAVCPVGALSLEPASQETLACA